MGYIEEDIIKVNLKEVECEVLDYIQLPEAKFEEYAGP